MLRARLKGEDDRPMIYFFENCADTIRTLPMLQHDMGKAAGAFEDVDTHSEDHAGDETRYACMARPWVAKAAPPQPKRVAAGQFTISTTFNDLIAHLGRALGVTPKTEYFDNPYGFYQEATRADMTRSNTKMGFKAAFPPADGIADYVHFLKTRTSPLPK
jgi:hypothetical protein